MKTLVQLIKKTTKLSLSLLFIAALSTRVSAQMLCQASFTYSETSNGQVIFTSNSTGTTGNTSYFWNWGDQSAQIATSTSNHVFGYNGTYLVSLTITDSLVGCSSTFTDSVIVTTAPPCNIHASFTYVIDSTGCVVTFTNTSTGSFANSWYSMSFGNGSSGSGTAQGYSGTTTSYMYNGNYIVTLSINGGGCSSTFSDTVTITNQATCNLVTDFIDSIGTNGQVSFYNISTGVLSNMQYFWSFGDGSTSGQVNPSHMYLYNGMYYATLFIRDSSGVCTDSIGKYINISNATNPCYSSTSFSVLPDSSVLHTWYVMPNYSQQATNAVWTWGDGSSSTGLYPTHTYASAGNYTICVTAYYACGDSATYCSQDTLSKTASTNQVIQVTVVNASNGIKNINEENISAKLYPSPTNGRFTIEIGGINASVTNAEISMTDMIGQSVYKTNQAITNGKLTKEINVQHLQNGIYYVRINTGNNLRVLKVVLN